MDAQPELALLAKVLKEKDLEAVLIGNMAAALRGAPVSTIDIDFYFRSTPRNVTKLKAIARALGAVIMRPYYPVSSLFRLQRESDGMQIDFMGQIDGIRSYEGLRKRATTFKVGPSVILVAALADIIRSKRSAALKLESDRALTELIRYRLSLPPEKRLNVLRKKIGLRASCL
jgi:hypothetical protein